jgi:hypothetical protein
MRSIRTPAKCMVQESLGLLPPFSAEITLTFVSRVHPLTVIHPLTEISTSNVTINCIYTMFLLSNR